MKSFTTESNSKTRRNFLRMLAMTPLLPYLKLPAQVKQAVQQQQAPNLKITDELLHVQEPDGLAPAITQSMADYDAHLKSASGAITVFDLEAVARQNLNVGHMAQLLGSEDGSTLVANREGYAKIQMRPRVLVDCKTVDTSVTLFGKKWATPTIVCPIGAQRAFNPEAEVAVAKAAKTRGHLMALSTSSSTPIEDVDAAYGQPVWFQLYRYEDWSKTLGMIRRAEASGSKVLVWTLDALYPDKREALARVRRDNVPLCQTCHSVSPNEGWNLKTLNNAGFEERAPAPMRTTPSVGPKEIVPGVTWDYVKRLKDATSMKVVLKGITAPEDAELALRHGADGIWVSNHGGRVVNSGRGTIECLPEVARVVAKRCPIIVDGGLRRGTDIYKALALGATAVGVGRPYLWGLAAFGQAGVEVMFDILDSELRMVMAQMGTPKISDIHRRSVITAHDRA
jgi:isopentenyl diphosphate isomerase/L-lactate dehydrogenase-like FMN-dependent dehydrogenase